MANSINVLQACIYKSVKQAYFYVATSVVYCEFYHAFLLKNLVLKRENQHQHIELDKT